MKFSLFILLGLLASFSAIADDGLEEELNTALSRLLPDVQIDSVKPTPVDGLYQITIGPDVVYMTRDGKYVFKGEILDIKERRNLTEDVRAGARVELLDSISKDDYIEFTSENTQDAIYVFTDIDCGYCRKLHRDVPELNSRGVSVRYLAYPRAGVESAAGREMSYVWCAEDRQKALTAAKNRESIEAKSCNDPVAEQYELGQKLGVRGTPAIYLQNGRMLPGYMPPNEIIKQLKR
jgi:thiol:disulfide interchange protein DsbC